jgi:PAS domain S-box-containing protein
MAWLTHALIFSMAGALFLSAIYLYLYSQDGEKYLITWAVSWAIYCLRFTFQFLSIKYSASILLTLGDMLATWVSSILLVLGTFQFVGRKAPGWMISITVLGSVLIGIAVMVPLSFQQRAWPLFLFSGAIFVWTGIQILKSPRIIGPGKLIIGWTFILWGVHKLDYPLLRPIEWFAPWGFTLASLFTFIVGLGMILIYYHRMRHDLRYSEARFRLLFDQAPLSYLSVDAEGKIIEVNQSWLDMLGYTREEVLGRSLSDFLPPDYQTGFGPAFENIKTSGELHNIEFEIICKGGTHLPVAAEGKVSYTENGDFEHTHCILQDITGLRATERALQERTIQQEQLLNTARSLTESLDLREVLERIGQSAKDLLSAYGCSLYLLEPSGETLTPMVALEDFADEILSEVLTVDDSLTGQCIRQRRALIFNNAYQEPSGHQIPGTPEDQDERLIVAPFIVDNQVLGAMCLNRIGLGFTPADLALVETFAAYASTALKNAQDHTALQREVQERIQAEQAKVESEERYRNLFENNQTVMILLDPGNNKIVDANPAACHFYGYSLETLTSLSFFDLNTLPRADLLKKLEQIRRQKLTQTQFKHRLANGELRDVDVFVGTIRMNGEPLIYAIIHDVTERAQRERETEIIVQVSTALRSAQTRADMLPIILSKTREVLPIDRAAICTYDPNTGESVVDLIDGEAMHRTGLRIPPGMGIAGHVIRNGKPYLTNDAASDQYIYLNDDRPPQALAAAPLIAKNETIGALVVGSSQSLSETDLRLLTAISEIAASAIHRASLFEETQRRVQRLDALHTIDIAITSNFNLNATLKVLLEQVTSQLDVDAAAILLHEGQGQVLRYAAGRGFRTNRIQWGDVTLEDNMAGVIVHQQRLKAVLDMRKNGHLPERIRKLSQEEGFQAYVGLPLTARSQVKGVLELYHRQPLDQDTDWWNFLDNLARQTAIAIDNATLFDDLQSSNQSLTLAYDRTLEGWAKALELRDKETEGHSKRVTELTMRLAQAMGITSDEMVHVRRGTMLHDIGKMGLPDSILLKPGPLTPDEWEVMHQHPVYAYNLLSTIPYLEKALDIPYCHHEKWDGSGYPRGLKCEQIPLAARIFAVIDVFDALLSDRPYRPAWPQERVLAYLSEQSGAHFDPRVVEAFLQMQEGSERLPSPALYKMHAAV